MVYNKQKKRPSFQSTKRELKKANYFFRRSESKAKKAEVKFRRRRRRSSLAARPAKTLRPPLLPLRVKALARRRTRAVRPAPAPAPRPGQCTPPAPRLAPPLGPPPAPAPRGPPTAGPPILALPPRRPAPPPAPEHSKRRPKKSWTIRSSQCRRPKNVQKPTPVLKKTFARSKSWSSVETFGDPFEAEAAVIDFAQRDGHPVT